MSGLLARPTSKFRELLSNLYIFPKLRLPKLHNAVLLIRNAPEFTLSTTRLNKHRLTSQTSLLSLNIRLVTVLSSQSLPLSNKAVIPYLQLQFDSSLLPMPPSIASSDSNLAKKLHMSSELTYTRELSSRPSRRNNTPNKL